MNPIALKKDDGIGLIAPAGSIQDKDIQEGMDILTAAGFQLKYTENLYGKSRYFSGTIPERVSDIHKYLQDPEVKVLYAVRGGMGSMQLLPDIDFKLWKKNKKLLIGFSDITALQFAVWAESGVRSLSGMTLTLQLKRENPYTNMFLDHLTGKKNDISAADLSGSEVEIMRPGTANGILMGGTLSMIISVLGTPYFPLMKDFILYIEDIDEPLYRVERALIQLKLGGILDKVNGLILGQFLEDDEKLELWPDLAYLFPEDIPVIRNFPYGHLVKSCALPFGIPVRLSTNPLRLDWSSDPI